jgi:hypothetical protein
VLGIEKQFEKQSQCQNGQNGISSLKAKNYGDFRGFGPFWVAKNKPNQSQFCRSGRTCPSHPHPFGMRLPPKIKLKKQSQFLLCRRLKTVEAGCEIGIIKENQIQYETKGQICI